MIQHLPLAFPIRRRCTSPSTSETEGEVGGGVGGGPAELVQNQTCSQQQMRSPPERRTNLYSPAVAAENTASSISARGDKQPQPVPTSPHREQRVSVKQGKQGQVSAPSCKRGATSSQSPGSQELRGNAGTNWQPATSQCSRIAVIFTLELRTSICQMPIKSILEPLRFAGGCDEGR